MHDVVLPLERCCVFRREDFVSCGSFRVTSLTSREAPMKDVLLSLSTFDSAANSTTIYLSIIMFDNTKLKN